jgi:hypothetical protein
VPSPISAPATATPEHEGDAAPCHRPSRDPAEGGGGCECVRWTIRKRKEAVTRAKIRSMDLDMELERKTKEYEKFNNKNAGVSEVSVDELERPNQATHEILKEVKHQNVANELRLANEMEISNFIKAAGGKEFVTPEMEELFKRSRDAVEQMIKENGLDR